MLTAQANPALHAAQANVPVVVKTNKDECSFQFNPVGTAKFTKECDIAKALLARSAVNYTTENQPAGTPTVVSINGKDFPVADPNFAKAVPAALTEAGYPSATANPTVIKASNPIDIFTGQKLAVVGILTILVLYVTMVYGPIAAALVELFPTRIRYTSMSLPYHIGNGWFGGLLPATAFAMVAQTGDIYYGLWYPIVIALFTFVIGLIFIPETKDRDILA